MSYESDRDEILGAIDAIADENSTGLCAAFYWSMSDLGRDLSAVPGDLVMSYLRGLGSPAADGTYAWSADDCGLRQRLTFLAFMLTWLDDYHGRNWEDA